MDAIGLIEVIGYVAAIEASDACLKSANVNIVRVDKVGAGIVTLTMWRCRCCKSCFRSR